MADYQINSDSNLGKKLRTVEFFNLYFERLKYILLSNLLFVIFDLIAAAYAYLMIVLSGGINIILLSLATVFLNVGMAGITPVCRYIYTKKEFSVVKAFFKGIKENWSKFLLHGIIWYTVFAVSYSSIALYYSGTKTNSLFWVPLVITGLISLLALFASFYMNIMTVTMDISLKNIYRNCLLFSFGEMKNNFFVTLALAIFGVILFTIAVIVNNLLAILIIMGAITVFIAPSTIQYIITFYVYDDMIGILDESRKGEYDDEEKKPENSKPQIEKEEAEEISRLVSDSKDEYIFHNGRMIKRSAVEEQLGENASEDFD